MYLEDTFIKIDCHDFDICDITFEYEVIKASGKITQKNNKNKTGLKEMNFFYLDYNVTK